MGALRTLRVRVSAVLVCEELCIEAGVQELGRASAGDRGLRAEARIPPLSCVF